MVIVWLLALVALGPNACGAFGQPRALSPAEVPTPQVTLVVQATAQAPGTPRGDGASSDATKTSLYSIEDLHITGTPPEAVDIAAYRLQIDGRVATPLSLTYDEVLAYPQITAAPHLICPGFWDDLAEWTGPSLAAIMARAGVSADATEVIVSSLDGYSITLPLAAVMSPDTFLAYKVDGQVLPLEHGYPLRLVVPNMEGGKWVKWLAEIYVR